MQIVALSVFIIGLIVIFIRQELLKKAAVELGSMTKWIFNLVIGVCMVGTFAIYTYSITDTYWEWSILTLLLFSAFGLNRLLCLGIKKLQRFKWLLPSIILPMISAMYIGISYAMVVLSISEDSHALVIGMMTALACAINDSSKEKREYRKMMFIEVILLYLVLIVGGESVELRTKPMQMIYEKLKDVPEGYECVTVREGIESPVRGKEAAFRVFIEEKEQLIEIRNYTYFNGEVTLQSTNKYR